MFEISVRKEFTASHALRREGRFIEDPHEHEWICEISLTSYGVDDAGTVADFREVDEALERAIAPLEGRSLHEAESFLKSSPSAENVARFLYRSLKEGVGEKLRSVRVWEDANHSATYYE